MINKSKSKKNLKMIIIGILIINIITGFQALLVDNAPIENVSLENISPDAGSGVISILETTPYGGLFASGWDHNEHEYYELNIVTNFGPGLTWYMMNDSEYLYNIGLDRNSRTRGSFPYTELLSDEELSASCVFYPLYSDKWYVVAINHYEFTASEIEFTDSWEDDFITVDEPTSSSSWKVETSHYINWTCGGNFANVDIALYHDGTFLSQIATNVQNNGSYPWWIPIDIPFFGDQYQVNISNSNYADTWGINDAYFEIWDVETINVINPSTSNSWEIGTTHSLAWTSTCSITDVKIELFKSGVFELEIIPSTPNDGDFSWTVPSGLDNSTQYQIKITDVSNSLINDYSDYFEIFVTDSIIVTSPDSFSSWEIGTTHSLAWTSTGSITDVKIELFKGGVFELEIIPSTPNDGDFSWTIPSGLDNSTQYQIKITDVSNSLINDYSDYFEIFGFVTDSITVTSPDSFSSWEIGTTHSLAWISTGSITDVKIELYKGDALELEIASSTFNDGDFSWTIPSGLDNSTQYQIKITDVSDPLINIYGDYFEIYTNPSPSESNNIPGYELMILYGLSIASLLGVCVRVIFSLRKKRRTSECM
ncbi:Ser-Thr-rich GPI-anchored membrane family protein [Promethearchaeum syntrophicum]|uniref:Ser-Thr-rich GPI-anchored membrane family protein n=1 Tax=Promethearchaeum syntrophicum TaxID=2594042 RepID=A0A5B9D6W9_9ARCH|nr:Ser-Thr-rich GPI-anchored membrane family protein [Candidatus Prometheoarchaeum syntrophicum]QEE14547.1 Ser-Thr-rich glycosyl-phosphatidyl-inositol-anchored membrane family protein [Candidatus Prometheoarchaeum syntrophicum]